MDCSSKDYYIDKEVSICYDSIISMNLKILS